MWERKLTEFINRGLDGYPFPLNVCSLMVLVPVAFVYFILRDIVVPKLEDER